MTTKPKKEAKDFLKLKNIVNDGTYIVKTTNKLKDTKWVEKRVRKELIDAYNQAASIDDCSDVECLIRRAISLVTQTRQDTLEWCEKEVEKRKVSEKTIMGEIRDFSRKLSGEDKQKIRAKNYGWNLCIEEMRQLIKQKMGEKQ